MNIKRVLRKTGKTLLISLLSIIVLVLLLFTIAINSENTISRLALEKVSQIVKAPISVDNVSLRLFRHFPNLTVEFNDFTVGKQFENNDTSNFEITDTLVKFRKLYVSVKSKPLFFNKIEINNIEIDGIRLKYFVDTVGVSNLDFLIAADTTKIDSLEQEKNVPIDTSETNLNILLADLTLGDIILNYDDKSIGAEAQIFIPKIKISGKIDNDKYQGSIKGSVILTNCAFKGTNLDMMQKTQLGFNVIYDNGLADIKSLELITDGATIETTGTVNLADSIGVDLTVLFKNFDLKELIKYAPNEITKEFGITYINGVLDVETQIKGYIFDTLLLPTINAKIDLKNAYIRTIEYPEIQKLNISSQISVENPNNLSTVKADIENLSFAINKSNFKIACQVFDLNKINYNITLNSNINIDDFTTFIPDSTVEYISGIIAFNMHTKGVLPEDIGINSADYFLRNTTLDIKIRNLNTALDSVNVINQFGVDLNYLPGKKLIVENLKFDLPEYAAKLDKSSFALQIIGDIANLDKLGININSFNIVSGNNAISGFGSIAGLNKPDFKLKTTAKIDLDEVGHFVPDSLVQLLSGNIELKIDTYGKVDLDSIDKYINPIVFEQTKIDLNIKDFNFEMFDDTLVKVKNMSFDLKMAQDTIRIDKFYANLHGIDMNIDSTEIWNFYKTFMLEQKNVPLIANANIRLSEIDYNKFAYLFISDSTQTDNISDAATPNSVKQETVDSIIPSAGESYMPPFIARGTLAVKNLKYDNIVLNDIFTKFRVDDSLYVIDQFRLKAFGGSMTTSAVYDMRNRESTTIMFKNSIEKMDLHKILVEADNFGQQEFTQDNISGILTSDVDGRIIIQGDSVLYDKIIVRGDFKLENGGIYNYEPIRELGAFTNLRELDNIVFKTMKSGVSIYNNNIYFPKTDIVSTAIDVSAFGMVSFKDSYQLHLNVHLGDVLAGKSDKLLKSQGKESDLFDGKDESNRKGLNLLALNRDGNTKYGFDNKRMQKIMTAEIKVQERGLSLLFHPKLVNYSTNLNRKEVKKTEKSKSNTTAPITE